METYRPKVEECEPRVLLRGYWLGTVVHELNRSYKIDKENRVPFTDPFCNGTDPGPCAQRDPAVVRQQLLGLDTWFHGNLTDIEGELSDARMHLQDLQDHHALDQDIVPTQIWVNYLNGRDLVGMNQEAEINTLGREDDGRIIPDAEALITRWWGQEQALFKLYGRSQRRLDRAWADRAQASVIINAAESVASISSNYDQQSDDIEAFLSYVR